MTEKNEQKFSKPFETKINLDPENFDINNTTIINTCNFKKKDQRFEYYMFDLDKDLFITNTNDLIEAIKPKKLLTMRNCQNYAKRIIDRLREEEERYKLGKNVNLDNDKDNIDKDIDKSNNIKAANNKKGDTKKKETTSSSNESNLKLELYQFKKNLNCDIFAEEFISYEGIKYLVSFVKYSTGNIRKLALEVLNRLLDFQSSNDYINKNEEIIVTLYEILMKVDNIESNKYAINILMTVISQDQAKAKYLLDVAEEYAKKSRTKIYSQIVRFFKDNEIELRTKTLILINVLLTFCDAERFPILEKQLKEAGIYEELEKISNNRDSNFQEQLTNFQIKTGKIISKSDYELQVYTKQMEEMEYKCEEAEIKYEETIQNQIMYERIIEELIHIQENMKRTKGDSSGYMGLKGTKTRFEQIEGNKNIPYVENGIFDFVSIFKKDQIDEHKPKVDLMEKYYKTQKECKKLNEENKELEIKHKALIEKKILNLKNILENTKLNKEKLEQEKKELETELEELSKKELTLKKKLSSSLLKKKKEEEKPKSTEETQASSSSKTNPSESKETAPVSKEIKEKEKEKEPPQTTQASIPPPPSIPLPPGVPPPPGVPLPPGVPPPPGVPMPPGVPPPPGVPMPPGVPPPPGVPMPPGAPSFFMAPVGPQPTKPKIQLKIKLKPIQWNRILLLPENDPNRPDLVWNSIKEPEIDLDEITSLFSAKKKEKPKVIEQKPKVIKKTFLDPKRAQEVGISRAKLPPIDVISKALITMDNSNLTEDNIDALLLIAITKEELAIYKEKQNSEGVWEKNEMFIVKLNDIPNYKEKLQIWSTILKYDFVLPKLTEAFNYMLPACKELKESKHFQKVLSTILSLGNIMNAGTAKGQADGFSLDLLPKLSGIKDTSGNSLLNFVASKTNQEDNTFEGFKNKFPNLEKAAGYSLNETKKKLDEVTNMVNAVEKGLKDLNTGDEFCSKANNSLFVAQEKIKELKKKEEENIKVYHETVKYFGYKEKDKYYDENGLFFKMLLQFFKEVDNNMPKLDVKKVIDYQKLNMGKKIDQSELMKNLMSQLKKRVQG